MDGAAMLKERRSMMDNVYQFKHNSRVMLGSNSYTWSILDAGYRFNEALYDYDKLKKVVREHHQRYGFDIYTDVQNRNPVRVSAILGGKTRVDDRKQSIWVEDRVLMEPTEYKEFTEDMKKFYFTKVFRRCVKEGLTLGQLKVALREWDLFRAGNTERMKMLVEEYGCLLYFSVFPKVPFEVIFSDYRGIKGMSMDLRRHKAEMKELFDLMYETQSKPALDGAIQNAGASYFATGIDPKAYVAPVTYAMLGYTILNDKQFEELYWPYLGPAIQKCVDNGVRLYIHAEGSMLRFAEYFQDIPKGYVLLHLEQDDPFEVRKKLPNIALAGGMPCTLLRSGTKQECVDYAHKLIDGLGDGFVLDQDKMMSFPQDCNGENLAAVNEFARNYRY